MFNVHSDDLRCSTVHDHPHDALLGKLGQHAETLQGLTPEGVGMVLFSPFVAKAVKGENHLGPYAVAFVFAVGELVYTIPLNYIFMRNDASVIRTCTGKS